MNTQQKLLRMLEMLLYFSSGVKRTLAEVSEKFEISERTAIRYIQTFCDAGFIIPKATNGLYFIDKDSSYFREINELLHFSNEEAFILHSHLGIRCRK